MKRLIFAVLMLLSSIAFADSIALTDPYTLTITFTQPNDTTNINKKKTDKFWIYCPSKNSATNELVRPYAKIISGTAASGNPTFIGAIASSQVNIQQSSTTGINAPTSIPFTLVSQGDSLLTIQSYGSLATRYGVVTVQCVGVGAALTPVQMQLMPTVQGATVDMTKGVIKSQIADNSNF